RKKQWGTCDTNGDLTFSWRLSMAKKSCIDYVIVHELCHRKFMDHSKQFWKAVEQVLPDYKAREQWLNDNSVNMTI
ncbi:MAG: M48 family metallopeptidase, partial [Agathobacter sp.]|nr:M48 family metallopeptidase [Agathobacter sp.]